MRQHFTVVTSVLQILIALRVMFRIYRYVHSIWSSSDTYTIFPGLDYPIDPLGTCLGPRAFRGPQALYQTNTIAIIGLKNCILPKFFARAYGAHNTSTLLIIGFIFAVEMSISALLPDH